MRPAIIFKIVGSSEMVKTHDQRTSTETVTLELTQIRQIEAASGDGLARVDTEDNRSLIVDMAASVSGGTLPVIDLDA